MRVKLQTQGSPDGIKIATKVPQNQMLCYFTIQKLRFIKANKSVFVADGKEKRRSSVSS